MIGNQRRYCKLKEKNAAHFYDVNSTRQIEIRSASLKTQGISRYDPTLKMLTTPAKLTSYPFNIGANKLLVNRANIRKHYTEILIAVRNGMRLKTSNNLIAVICVCWVLQLKKPCSTWIHWEPANLRSRCLLSRILFSISYFSHLS